MQLHMSPTSPFVRKVRVAVRELGLTDRVDEIAVDPWTDTAFRALNPLSKVPVLVTDDGTVLFESLLLVEYLDHQADGRLVPPPGPARWAALSHHALAQGMMEATLRITLERRLPEAVRNEGAIARSMAAVTAALGRAEAIAPAPDDALDVGTIGLGCALFYLDLRLGELDWREDRPRLAALAGALEARSSFADTRPPG